MKTRNFLFGLLATAWMLTFVSPTLAKAPTIETFEFYEQVDLDCSQYGFAYTARYDSNLKMKVFTFYNNDDSISRWEYHFNIAGTVTNLATGTIFKDQSSYKSTYYPSGKVIHRGVIYHLRVPGDKIAAHKVGRVVIEGQTIVFEAGINMDTAGNQVVCEGLANK